MKKIKIIVLILILILIFTAIVSIKFLINNSLTNSPDKVYLIKKDYQVLGYEKEKFYYSDEYKLSRDLKHTLKIKDEDSGKNFAVEVNYNCAQQPINKIINLELNVSEYSLLLFNFTYYNIVGGNPCLNNII